jgi:hypothetical protein
MGTIEDYRSGGILDGIGKALHVLDSMEKSAADSPHIIRIQEKILEFRPTIISFDEASAYIGKATTIALGERVCRTLHPDSVFSLSVFLDELAIAMIESGKARTATAMEAEQSLKKQRSHPLIISMVSGRYQEICASYPKECVFWKAERQGLHCLKRKSSRIT